MKLQLSNFKGGVTPKMYRQELWLLYAARRLMMLYISIKFYENILNCFQVIKRTQNYRRISKGNNSKNVYTRDRVQVLCTLSDDALFFYEVS